MNADNHADMHHDHQHWLADNAMWRDDIKLWRRECRRAMGEGNSEDAFRELARAIDEHEEIIDRHIEKITVHENAVAGFERTQQGDTIEMLTLAKAHKKEAAEHGELRLAHEWLKKEHHRLMVHWAMLSREVTITAG